MREAILEAYLVGKVKELGGITAKMTVAGQRGWPDRLVCLPGGKVALLELKRPKRGALSPRQKDVLAKLFGLGVMTGVVNSTEEIDTFMRAFRSDYSEDENRRGAAKL